MRLEDVLCFSENIPMKSSTDSPKRSFVVTDPALPDNPIVFASQGFLDLTRYKLEEVLGRNCRFLQGGGSDTEHVDALRQAVSSGADTTSVCLLNYKADGTSFYNQVFIAALRDVNMRVINYVGVQVEVNELFPNWHRRQFEVSSTVKSLNCYLIVQVKPDYAKPVTVSTVDEQSVRKRQRTISEIKSSVTSSASTSVPNYYAALESASVSTRSRCSPPSETSSSSSSSFTSRTSSSKITVTGLIKSPTSQSSEDSNGST